MMITGWIRGLRSLLWRRLGFRGTFLALIGAFDLFLGWYLMAGGLPRTALVPPVPDWAVTWLVVGGIQVAAGFLATRRDVWFFALSAFLKTAWACEFFLLEVLHPGHYVWLLGMQYLVLAATVLLAAAWPQRLRPGTGPP